MIANGPRERLANPRNIRLVTYLLKVRIRLRNILSSLKKGQSQLLWCQCAHDNLNERIGAVDRWKFALLAREQQIRQDIANAPTQHTAAYQLEIDTGDHLFLPACSEPRCHDGEPALGEG